MSLPPLADIAGRKVLFAMAAEPEYGPHLRKLFTPLMTGVGPVEAALHLGVALAGLRAAGAPPDLVVSLGSAGSRKLRRTQVYQGVSVTFRDMDATAFGFARGVTPYLDLPATVPLPLRIPGVPEATISTGSTVIAGAVFDNVAEDMVEMETFAVLRACQTFALPLIALRGISDGDTDVSHIGDWLEYLHVVDENLADAIGRMETALRNGSLML